jgi:hypothetical protein
MRLFILLCLLLATTSGVYAQKYAKVKKGIISVGGQSFLKYQCDNPWGENCLYLNANGDKVILIKAYFWKREYNSGNPYNKYYYEIEFWGTDLKMYSTRIIESIFFNMYDMSVINSDGSVNIEKAEEFIKVHGVEKPNVSFVD